MNPIDKQAFLALVQRVVTDDPEIVVALYATIQAGIRERLRHEMHERSELAVGFSVLWQYPNGKKKYRNQLIRGAEALARFYEGSRFGEIIKEWIKGDKHGTST